MDTSYLAQQVNTIIGQLHGLFDEIGVPNHDRDAREEEVRRKPCRTACDGGAPVLTASVTALCGAVRCLAEPSPPRGGREEGDG